MSTSRSVALLRGINVGTSKRIAMPALRSVFEGLGATNVETYLQSGNVVFSGSLKPAALEAAVAAEFGVTPRVLVLTAAEFRRAASENPLLESAADPSRLFVYFVDAVPASIEPPDGIGKTKVPPRFTKSLGPTATARNQRTVEALLAMLDA